jgi:hypothetical protein
MDASEITKIVIIIIIIIIIFLIVLEELLLIHIMLESRIEGGDSWVIPNIFQFTTQNLDTRCLPRFFRNREG